MAKPIESCYRALGARVENIRAVLGITQEDLSKRTTLTRGSIANIEVGRQRVLLHQIEELATALGTTPKGLLRGIYT